MQVKKKKKLLRPNAVPIPYNTNTTSSNNYSENEALANAITIPSRKRENVESESPKNSDETTVFD